jgi:ubiquinone/menaquinone biosynthesis C-methylase UbiE
MPNKRNDSRETTMSRQYNRIAPVYDRVWSRYVAKSLGFLQHWAVIGSDETVLDVGCGTGTFEHLILQTQPEQAITGVDLSAGMLAIARQKCQGYPQVGFTLAAATDLPFADCSFDRVVTASALHHFADPQAALQEMRRVLKPKGELVILDWCNDDWRCRVYDFVLRRFDPAHQRCYTQAELHGLLAGAGYQVQRTSRFSPGPAWMLMVASAKPTDLQ